MFVKVNSIYHKCSTNKLSVSISINQELRSGDNINKNQKKKIYIDKKEKALHMLKFLLNNNLITENEYIGAAKKIREYK